MPIFDYICDDCGKEFEFFLRGSDEASCPACESTSVTRQLPLPKVKSSKTHAKAMKAARKRDQRLNAQQTRTRIEYEEAHDD